eukprot:2998890-Rhodomonas_salina.1
MILVCPDQSSRGWELGGLLVHQRVQAEHCLVQFVVGAGRWRSYNQGGLACFVEGGMVLVWEEVVIIKTRKGTSTTLLVILSTASFSDDERWPRAK